MRRALPVIGGGLLLAVIVATEAWAQSSEAERYNADIVASHLTVEGTSTLHNWVVEGKNVGGYLIFHENELASLWTTSGPLSQPLAPAVHVEIPVASLTSGKRGMDEKMHEALKATTHPLITYRLESAQHAVHHAAQADDGSGDLTIETKGVLTVAGVERLMDIPMRVRRLPENRLEISGDTSVRMTEFGIEPPRVMLGTLRTGNAVRVRWTWVLARDRIDDNRDAQ